MTWAALEWPELPADFPEPQPILPPPPRPDVPTDIAAQVERAEKRRSLAVKTCVLVGAAFGLLGIVLAAQAPGRVIPTFAVIALALGLVIAFPLAALLALWLGPNWTQRQQHWRLLHWQHNYQRWLNHERDTYLASLPPAHRARCRQALDMGQRPAR
jgi:hypothetical protein